MLVRDLPQDEGLRFYNDSQDVDWIVAELQNAGADVTRDDYGSFFIRMDADGEITDCYALEGCIPYLNAYTDVLLKGGEPTGWLRYFMGKPTAGHYSPEEERARHERRNEQIAWLGVLAAQLAREATEWAVPTARDLVEYGLSDVGRRDLAITIPAWFDSYDRILLVRLVDGRLKGEE